MTARQRGATCFLALLFLGRVLDHLDLPFERSAGEPRQTDAVVGNPSAVPDARSERVPEEIVTPSTRSRSGETHRDSLHAAGPQQVIAINRASAQELEKLPGIGPALALRIVSDRQEHGPLQSPEDLCRIRGIGPRTAARLAPLLRFD